MNLWRPGVRGERWLLRLGEILTRIASRRLPRRVRDERCREWMAELPVILHDPDGGRWPRRAARMLGYALDTIRGTTVGPKPARYQGTHSGKPDDWWVPVLAVAAVLVVLPGLVVLALALPGLYVYFAVRHGSSLGFQVFIWVFGGVNVAWLAIRRRRTPAALWLSPSLWLPATAMLIATGSIARIAAGDSHWRGTRLHAVTLANSAMDVTATVFFSIGLLAVARLLILRWAAWRDARRPAGNT
jgi:hypothetical protein